MLDNLNQSLQLIIDQTNTHLYSLEIIALVLWGMYILTLLTGRKLLYLGIIPRHLLGLIGIIFAPFLHADFNHIFFNTIPLLVLSDFVLINGLPYFIKTLTSIMLISGLLTWAFARPAIHIGASGVITGLWSLLMINAYQHPSLTTIILGIICIYYFAGIFLGIFPSQKGISWEGHLFGLISGVLTGWMIK